MPLVVHEEAADSITDGNISSGVIYGESGADTFNISQMPSRHPFMVALKTTPSPSVDLVVLWPG